MYRYHWQLACVLVFLLQGATVASQESAPQSRSLFDPTSARAAPEITFTSVEARRLRTSARKKALPRPPHLPSNPPANAGSYLLDTLVPTGGVTLKSRTTGEEILLDDTVSTDAPTRELTFPLAVAAVIATPFGPQVNPVTGENSFHRGVDLAAPEGTPVLAAYSGIVLASGPLGALGNTVVLAHGNARRSRYGHLLETLVKPGEYIRAGTVIGRVGSSGRTSGPHLHFEYWLKSGTATWEAQDVTASLAR